MLERRLLNTRYLEGPQQVAEVRQDWLALAEAAEYCPPYATYSWYRSWQSIFGTNKRHGIFVTQSGDQITAIRSMMFNRVWRGPALSSQYDYTSEDAQFLNQKPKYRFLPARQISSIIMLESANFRDTALTLTKPDVDTDQSWLESLSELPDWDIARIPYPDSCIERILRQAATAGMYGFSRKHRMPIYHMQLVPYRELAEKRSSNFRRQMGRAIERAHALPGGYRLKSFIGKREATHGLDLLGQIAEKSWKMQGRDSEALHLPFTSRSRDFFYRLCTDDDSELTPYIQILCEGHRPFSGVLTLIHKDRLFGAMTYYDPAYTQLSPGRLLFIEVLDQAHQLGCKYFDLNGGSPFVEYFADGVDYYHQVIIFNQHPYSRMLRTFAQRFSSDIMQVDSHAHA